MLACGVVHLPELFIGSKTGIRRQAKTLSLKGKLLLFQFTSPPKSGPLSKNDCTWIQTGRAQCITSGQLWFDFKTWLCHVYPHVLYKIQQLKPQKNMSKPKNHRIQELVQKELTSRVTSLRSDQFMRILSFESTVF